MERTSEKRMRQFSSPPAVIRFKERKTKMTTVSNRKRHRIYNLRFHRGARVIPFAILGLTLVSCASGEAPPAAICDTYDRALFTTQLMGGAAVILGLAILGFKKNLSAILPSQGAQMGSVAGSVGLGLILLAFSTDIGNQILTGFGIESLYTLCGLG